MKMKTITLSNGCSGDAKNPSWRVERVTDSLLFEPGQMLTKKTVEELCESRFWKVTITRLAREAK